MKKTDAGLDVKLIPSNIAAFLPKSHLSDYMENCDILHSMYKEDDIIKEAMYFSKVNAIVSFYCYTIIKLFADSTAY